MPSEYLLLETGDHLLLETGDDLLLESSTVDQTLALALIDDTGQFGPTLSVAGVVLLPLIDDTGTFPPVVFEDKQVDLPLLDDAALFGPSVSGGVDLPLLDDAALFGPTITVQQRADLPLIDGGETFAPSFVQAQQLDLRFLDGGWPFAPLVEGQVLAGLAVYVGTTMLEPTTSPSFRDPIDDIGSFQLTLANDDADLALLDYGAIVRFEVDGLPVFQGVVRERTINSLAPGEELDHVTTLSGPGYLGIGTRDVIGPSRGTDALPIEEVRAFSWPAFDFDHSGWPLAKKVNRQREYASWRAPLPWIWPDTTGWWIWANLPSVNSLFAPSGVCLFRKTFTLASEALLRIFVGADNHLSAFYFDGAEVASFSSLTTGEYVEVLASAGTHSLAAKVRNDIKADLPNPGGFICAVYSVGDAGLLDELIVNTDATWRCLPYPTVAPGLTPGDVLYELRDETDIFDSTTFDFTRTLTSEGEPWEDFSEITVKVGRTYTEVMREMAASLADIAARPGGPVIQAWNKGERGVDRTATVTLTQTPGDPDASEFLKLSHAGVDTRADHLLIRYGGGYTEVSSGGADEVRAYLEAGHLRSETEAQRYGRQVMENRSEPAYATTARILPSEDGPQPYRDFGNGDTVMCLNEAGDLEAARVLAIMLDPDEVGVIEWGVELRDLRLELEELQQNVLRRAAEGHIVGGARVTSPAGTPAPTSQQIAALDVAEFSTYTQDTALPLGYGIARRAARSGNAVEIAATISLDSDDTPTSSATTFRVWWSPEGGAWEVLGGLVTVPAGETVAEIPLDLEAIKANVDRLRPQIVSAGSGAEGLDIQVRAI